MIKLLNILLENTDYPLKDNYINLLIDRDLPKLYINQNTTEYTINDELKNTNYPFYDFGGGGFAIDSPNNTIVDYTNSEYGAEFEPEDYINAKDNVNLYSGHKFDKFINADLNNYIKLPPKNAINIKDALYNFIKNPSTIAKTIDHALTPGGLLVIRDHVRIISKLLKKLPSYKLLELKIDTDIYDEYNTSNSIITVVLKK